MNAAAVGRYMSDLSYNMNHNLELANVLCRISDDLETFGTPFGKRWNDFNTFEKKIILECKRQMENKR
jgi:hypothetical protein